MPRNVPGHRGIYVPRNAPRPRQSAGGWTPTCKCGWSRPEEPTRKAAKAVFAAHLLQALPRCSACNRSRNRYQMSKAAPQMCKECSAAKTRAWAVAHPKEWERHARKHWLRKKYGLTPERFDELLSAQGGACAICGVTPNDSRGFRPHVDHDHATGQVRGILCHACNSGLGSFRDDETRLLAAVAYLNAARRRGAA